MMLAVSLSLLACFTQQDKLEVAKERLFTEWTTTSTIPMVMLGMPTDDELHDVQLLVQEIRKLVIAATSEDLSSSQRDLDVPFMLGMLDGIIMRSSNDAATLLSYLSELDDAVTGIAASRLWRMRLHAATLQEDEDAATLAVKSILSIEHADAEDLVAVTLYKIAEAFDRDDYATARMLYNKQDAMLERIGATRLRDPLASGYARLAPTKSEALFGWFTMAERFVDQGVDQQRVDQLLLEQLQRLPHFFELDVNETNPDNRLAALAGRLAIDQAFAAGNMQLALTLLMQRARKNDVHAAERVLMYHDAPAATPYVQEALTIVLSHPKQVRTSIAYWHLFAATEEIQRGNYPRALTFLARIEETSSYSAEARKLEQQLSAIDVASIIEQMQHAKLSDIPLVVERLVAESPPEIVQELLRHCIDRWHDEGIERALWIKTSCATLLSHSIDVAPSVLGETYRLLEQHDQAMELFEKSIALHGATVQTTAGLADCTRDIAAMRSVAASTSHDDRSAYWFWLSNVRLLQWYLEDGGDQIVATAKVNRLRREDDSLGGAMFQSQFNALSQSD
jgi:tetratricopeptide (TPR) repeat protein